ncbi:MAG TPA: 4-alpha-glucanotransferase [Methylophilus sp.]|nr:4-alpha-glucanotransferase [Methylophilus sp.]HQQ33531.1 4-alpha-glucanotransferase [Methylophilus sp.]
MRIAKQQYQAGVLLHISSLPLGVLGQNAFQFVDFLVDTGVRVWQTLPLNMPHSDGSPYQCLSAHAGNPAFISIQRLAENGLVTPTDLVSYFSNYSPAHKHKLLVKAYNVFSELADEPRQRKFRSFCRKHSHWLNDFAMFLVLRNVFGQKGWNQWPLEYKNRDVRALAEAKKQHADEIGLIKFIQFIFFEQWLELKRYANQKGVLMFGDIPIFVAYDSADVWANPELFKLDKHCNMTVVAGVPPDYFSTTGQRWGNPHYNWRMMKRDGFQWWLERMATQSEMFDMVRIDHFRGLQAAWEIPAKEDTAINGKWALAPGDALLTAIRKRFPNMCLVAEDLGVITDEVNALREKHHLPGMKILQFAFGGGDDNAYLPHHIGLDSVVYTGTHDNDTTLGWYNSAEKHVIQHFHAYIGNETPRMPDALMQMALDSKASLAIIPMQDILALDGAHRMNTPGTIAHNWSWQFNWAQLSDERKEEFKQMVSRSGRAPH